MASKHHQRSRTKRVQDDHSKLTRRNFCRATGLAGAAAAALLLPIGRDPQPKKEFTQELGFQVIDSIFARENLRSSSRETFMAGLESVQGILGEDFIGFSKKRPEGSDQSNAERFLFLFEPRSPRRVYFDPMAHNGRFLDIEPDVRLLLVAMVANYFFGAEKELQGRNEYTQIIGSTGYFIRAVFVNSYPWPGKAAVQPEPDKMPGKNETVLAEAPGGKFNASYVLTSSNREWSFCSEIACVYAGLFSTMGFRTEVITLRPQKFHGESKFIGHGFVHARKGGLALVADSKGYATQDQHVSALSQYLVGSSVIKDIARQEIAANKMDWKCMCMMSIKGLGLKDFPPELQRILEKQLLSQAEAREGNTAYYQFVFPQLQPKKQDGNQGAFDSPWIALPEDFFDKFPGFLMTYSMDFLNGKNQ